MLDRLRTRDVTCVFVSHRMQEIFRLCDTITVLRDGRHVATKPIQEIDEAALVQLMIGRRLEEYLPVETTMIGGGEVLRVERLSSPRRFADISFSVHAGEVVGIGGLVGAGRTDIAHAIFGLDPDAHGRVEVRGHPARPALARGGDARRRRLRPGGSQAPRPGADPARARERDAADAALAVARGWIRAGAERALAADAFTRLRVRTPDLDALTAGPCRAATSRSWLPPDKDRR